MKKTSTGRKSGQNERSRQARAKQYCNSKEPGEVEVNQKHVEGNQNTFALGNKKTLMAMQKTEQEKKEEEKIKMPTDGQVCWQVKTKERNRMHNSCECIRRVNTSPYSQG